LSLSDIRGSGGAPPEGEQEGGPPRGGQSGEGAGIPHLRTPRGSPFDKPFDKLAVLSKVEGRESIGAKGQWCSLVRNINLSKATTLPRSLVENSGNSCTFILEIATSINFLFSPLFNTALAQNILRPRIRNPEVSFWISYFK
jgi:hypothetical protein